MTVARVEAEPAGVKPASLALRAALLPMQAVQSLVIVVLAPVMPQLAAAWGGVGAAQLIAVVPALGITAGGVASGSMLRWLGWRRVALGAALAYLAGGLVAAAASSLPLLLGGALAVGLGAAFLTSALAAVTAHRYAGANRTRMLAHQAVAANALNVAVGLAGAALAGRFGWRVPFGLLALFGAVLLFQCAAAIPPAVAMSERSTRPGAVLARIWPVCAAAAAVFAVATAQSTELPFQLEAHGFASPTDRVLVVIATTACSLVASLAYGTFNGALPERGWIGLAAVGSAAGWLLFGTWRDGSATAYAAAGLLGLGVGITVPLLFRAVMRAAGSTAGGPATGLLGSAFFLGSFASPAATGLLGALAGPGRLMKALAVATLLLGVVAISWPRRLLTRHTE